MRGSGNIQAAEIDKGWSQYKYSILQELSTYSPEKQKLKIERIKREVPMSKTTFNIITKLTHNDARRIDAEVLKKISEILDLTSMEQLMNKKPTGL